MRSVLENLGNSAKESLDPAGMSVNRAFALSVSREGQICFWPGSLDITLKGMRLELDLARSNLIWSSQCLFTKFS